MNLFLYLQDQMPASTERSGNPFIFSRESGAKISVGKKDGNSGAQNPGSRTAEQLPAAPDGLAYGLMFYGIGFAVFHILPAFLEWNVWNGLAVADLFDLTTPFAIVFLIFNLYRKLAGTGSGVPVWLPALLILGSITFVEGHGMHLSANAIHRHVDPAGPSPLHALTYFFDERLGHILWDSGNLVMALGILFASLRIRWKMMEQRSVLLLMAAGLVYGFTFFVNAVEGQTVIFQLPAAIMLTGMLAAMRVSGRKTFQQNPGVTFFLAGYTGASLLMAIWWLWQGGFPEFSALGWI
jgi:hypothetical protein